MKRLFSKFTVLVPALFCVMTFVLFGLSGCNDKPVEEGHEHTYTTLFSARNATCVEEGVHYTIYKCNGCGNYFEEKEEGKVLIPFSQIETKLAENILSVDTNNHDYVVTYAPTDENDLTKAWEATAVCQNKGCDEKNPEKHERKFTTTSVVLNENKTNQSCVAKSEREYTLTFSEADAAVLGLTNKTHIETREGTVDQNKHSYDYANAVYTFGENAKSEKICTATVTCKNGCAGAGHTKTLTTESVEVNVNTYATCQTSGIYFLIATFDQDVARELNLTDRKYTSEARIIPCNSNAHNYQYVSTISATCTTPGETEHYKCTICDKVFDMNKKETNKRNLTISSNLETGHSYDEYSYNNGQYIASCLHKGCTTQKTQYAGVEGYPYLVHSSEELASAIGKGGYISIQNDFALTSTMDVSK